MVRDGVANIVSRLRECGCEPRKVGDDAWESRCPAHRSLDRALSVTRNEFNNVVLNCRSAESCTHLKIIRAVGFTNDHLYAETPDRLISLLRRVAVEPEERAEFTGERREIDEPANEAASPVIHETSHAAPLSPEAEIIRFRGHHTDPRTHNWVWCPPNPKYRQASRSFGIWSVSKER